MKAKSVLLWLPAALFGAGYIVLTVAGIYALFGMWAQ
jgi:hypothetical protein